MLVWWFCDSCGFIALGLNFFVQETLEFFSLFIMELICAQLNKYRRHEEKNKDVSLGDASDSV